MLEGEQSVSSVRPRNSVAAKSLYRNFTVRGGERETVVVVVVIAVAVVVVVVVVLIVVVVVVTVVVVKT